MKPETLQKYYTRIIGIFFILVALSLITDYLSNGHTPETWHKIFHVLLGSSVVYFGWNNRKFWKPFCLINGAFFSFVALFGFAFPDFAGLDAFNLVDTILHSIVGLNGLVIGSFGKFK
jgi:hypothetical protein